MPPKTSTTRTPRQPSTKSATTTQKHFYYWCFSYEANPGEQGQEGDFVDVHGFSFYTENEVRAFLHNGKCILLPGNEEEDILVACEDITFVRLDGLTSSTVNKLLDVNDANVMDSNVFQLENLDEEAHNERPEKPSGENGKEQ